MPQGASEQRATPSRITSISRKIDADYSLVKMKNEPLPV